MIKLLSFWLAWRTVRAVAGAAVILGLLAFVTDVPSNRHARPPLMQLRHSTLSLQRQLEHAIGRAFTR